MRLLGWIICGGIAAMLWPGAAAVGQTKLLLSSMSPGGSDNGVLFNKWADRVTKASNGTLVVEVKDGTNLAGFRNVYQRVNNDILQIGWIFHPMMRDKWPLTEVAGLPFIVKDEPTGSEALWRLYKTGLLDQEYKDVFPLFTVLAGVTGLHFAKEPKSLEDLSGLKVRVQGSQQATMAKRLGMSAQSIPAGDMYIGLQRGTVDAVLTSWSAFPPYKLHEVSFYHVEAPLGVSSNMFFMSRKKFRSLPAAARKAIEANSGDAVNKEFAMHLYNQARNGRKIAEQHGNHKFVTPSADLMADWEKRVGQPVIDQWLKATGAQGQKVLAEYRRLYAEVGAGK